MGEAATETLELDGPAMLSSARQFVADCLGRHDLDDLITDAQLVVSELATNVFLHVGGPATLSVATSPTGARVEVHDTSTVPPVRLRVGDDGMTGRGLHLVDGMASRWGVTQLPAGKVVWAELDDDGRRQVLPAAPLDADALLDMWADDDFDELAQTPIRPATICLGPVPTRLVLTAKGHVDNLVREFTLIAGGSASGVSEEIPEAVTRLIDAVVHGFADQRHALKQQALDAVAQGREEVELALPLPADLKAAITAGETYLDALDQADAYCRAARLLTLESSPQQRVFHRWYVEEFIGCLQAIDMGTHHTSQPFVDRLLEEFDVIAAAHRLADRAARLHSLAVALSGALSAQAVAQTVLDEGVTAMGASGGVVLLASDSPTLEVTGAVGHGDDVMARLRDEHPDAALPAATAMRTGEAVWLETPAERTARFPDLAGFEPATVAMCAVPLVLGERRLGALRFSFASPRLFDEEERQFVTALAAQTAQALHRAELHHQRRDMAERLRAALLPTTLPDLPGIEVAGTHHAPTGPLDIGGAFYDVWQAQFDDIAIAIGDACDGGPEAAAEAGLIRHTLRALTEMSLPLPQLVQGVHSALRTLARQDATGPRSCGMIAGLLRREEDGVRVDLAGGGHPHPLVVRAGGRVEAVALDGSRLGSDGEITIDRCTVALAPGDALVLLTAEPGHLQPETARTVLAGTTIPALDAATTLAAVDAALCGDDGVAPEDLAILVLRCR